MGGFPSLTPVAFFNNFHRRPSPGRDDDDDDDEVWTKKFFKFLHIRPPKHALCQLIAVGTTPCGNDFYY